MTSLLNIAGNIPVSAAAGGQSLRFEDGDVAYLSRTPESAGNRKTWTFSAWMKKGNLGSNPTLFSGGNSTGMVVIRFVDDEITVYSECSASARIDTNAKLRDVSAWYHITVAFDTSQSTASDRIKIYINGDLQTVSVTVGAGYPSLNYDSLVNNTVEHTVGNWAYSKTSGNNHDGYLANVTFIDGQALTPTSFGEYEDTLWKPKSDTDITSLTFGTNGFYLPFKQTTEAEGFSTVTYTGNNATIQSIEGVGFEPDFVWIKRRNSAKSHTLVDSVRGVNSALFSDTTAAEDTSTDIFESFDSNGFTVGDDNLTNGAADYVAWCWDAGSGSAVSNTDGSITSSVKSNTANGFSIVSYTGTGANATIGHGLSSAPEMIIFKETNASDNWSVYHTSIGNTYKLRLNGTNAQIGPSANLFNSTSPTSTVFSTGTDGELNGQMIAYCFHSVSGYSSIGSYTGTGGASPAVTVTTGFKPAFVMIKRTDSTGDWYMLDNTRFVADDNNNVFLDANTSDAEASASTNNIDFTSTGFVIDSTGSAFNASGGTYIYMAFADTRDATFFGDTSGNSNSWTPNKLNNTDVVPDSPVSGGNFATFNANMRFNSGSLSEGNLRSNSVVGGSSNYGCAGSTITVTSGKWYCEMRMDAGTVSNVYAGAFSPRNDSNIRFGKEIAAVYLNNIYSDGSAVQTGLSNPAVGDIFGFAVDVDNKTCDVTKNGSAYGSQVDWSGHTYADLGFQGIGHYHGASANNSTISVNYGQDSSFAGNETPQGNTDDNGVGDFYYAPPSGFLALTTGNLPTPTITAPDEYFNTVLYTGNGSTQSITGVGFQPSWLWLKNRSTSNSHALYDSVRGSGTNGLYGLSSNTTNAELDGTNVTSLDPDGFTLGSNSGTNGNGNALVAWNWLAGGTAVSNTDGSITSTVSANTDAGFSIATYTGNGTTGATIGHGLGVTPDLLITKNRSSGSSHWAVYLDEFGGTKRLLLSSTSAMSSDIAYWNNTDATSSVFSVYNNIANNASGDNYVAYAFHSVEGYSKIGSYTGNGSSNGTFVHCGFRPAWVMVKAATGAAQHWWMFDNKREGYNVDNDPLYANLSSAEGTSDILDFTSNGFKLRNSSAVANGSGQTFIFLAFAEAPFSKSNAR